MGINGTLRILGWLLEKWAAEIISFPMQQGVSLENNQVPGYSRDIKKTTVRN